MSIVPKPRGFGTREELIKHLKCIGMRIMDDADHIAVEPCGVINIEITAEISPGTEFTTVNYRINALADPRMPPYNAR